MDALRDTLNPWLGKPQWKQTEGRVALNYRFSSEDPTPLTLKLKVEINTRAHFSEHGFQQVPFSVSSRWFSGACDINTYDLDELLGTKLRALYKRRKGRDLFDMATALSEGDVDPAWIVAAFSRYMREEGHRITRAAFEENLAAKVGDARFTSDVPSLLNSGRDWNVQNAADLVLGRICPLLK